MYSFGFCFCEFLCLLNIVLQALITNRFLGTIETDWYEGSINFINLGRNICDWCSRPWLPLRMMFPRQSLCSMKYHGGGGGTNTLHASCLLTLNIIHDKVKKELDFANLIYFLIRFSLSTGFCWHLYSSYLWLTFSTESSCLQAQDGEK